jgi:1-acyl-sn-glycerol-3-phosphate acyltransferase
LFVVRVFFRVLAGFLTLSGAMRVAEVRNRELLRLRMPSVYVGNHRSMMDVLLLLSLIPNASCLLFATSRVAGATGPRRSVMPAFWKPFIMAPFSLVGYVPMPPTWNEPADLIGAFGLCVDKLRAGRPLVIFPEGTRSGTNALLPFQDFPFKLALKANVPVVPVVIHSDVAFMPKGSIGIDSRRRAIFRIVALPPIPPREGMRAVDLATEARRAIRRELAELDGRYGYALEPRSSGPAGLGQASQGG